MDSQPWRVVAASVPGTSHLKCGKPCQDAHQWVLLAPKVLVGAVSDGAGSAALSQFGASIAVRAALEWCARSAPAAWPQDDPGWRVWLTAVLQTAREAVWAEAAHRHANPRELAATLLVLVCTPQWTAAAQIGDGATIIADDSAVLKTLTRPGAGEYLNETLFLTSNDAIANAQLAVHPGPARQVAMLSDGLQMLALKMPAGEPHLPFFRPLFRLVRDAESASAQDQLSQFLRSARIGARTDDDLTLVLAEQKGEPDPGSPQSIAAA